jgi:Concanavalin A-like lectin/glucanases superfamily
LLGDTNPAMTFNGTTGKIVTAAPVALLTPYTIEVWVKKSGTVIAPLWSTRAGYPTVDVAQLFIQSNNGYPGLTLDYANTTSPEQNTGITTFVGDGQWHHLVVVLTALTSNLYLDGVVGLFPGTLPAPFTGASYPVTLGQDQFNGFGAATLDEVAIYPRALTPAEIAAHYTLATTIAGTRPPISLGWWKQGWTAA